MDGGLMAILFAGIFVGAFSLLITFKYAREAGSVSGGTMIDCTAEQNAKIEAGICPLCGQKLMGMRC